MTSLSTPPQRPEPLSPPQGIDALGLPRRGGLRGWFRQHPVWMSAVLAGYYLLTAVWGFPAALIDMGADAFWIVPGHAVVAAALFFRHTRPITVLLLVATFEGAMVFYYPWVGSQMVGLCFAAYAVAMHRGLIVGLIVSVPACAAAYAGLLRAQAWIGAYGPGWWAESVYPEEGAAPLLMLVVAAVTMVFMVGISAGIGAAVRRGRAHEREVLEWAQQSRELAQLGERNRIAREMHDVVAHSLSVMISLADGARVVARKNPERAAEVMGEVAGTGRTALADMRRVIGVLKRGENVAEARRPAAESLQELFEGFRAAGLPLRVHAEGPPLPEDTAFGLTVHRIIQESLTNVLRYGREVTEVKVSIEHVEGTGDAERARLKEQGFNEREQAALGLTGNPQVIITVTDDGVPSGDGSRRESVGSALGIRGMQERAGFYGGSVWAGPGKYRGWTVRAVLEPPSSPTPRSGG